MKATWQIYLSDNFGILLFSDICQMAVFFTLECCFPIFLFVFFGLCFLRTHSSDTVCVQKIFAKPCDWSHYKKMKKLTREVESEKEVG